jgi:hypothetical protein
MHYLPYKKEKTGTTNWTMDTIYFLLSKCIYYNIAYLFTCGLYNISSSGYIVLDNWIIKE